MNFFLDVIYHDVKVKGFGHIQVDIEVFDQIKMNEIREFE